MARKNNSKSALISRDSIHYSRYLRWKIGTPEAEIAKQDEVSVEAVKKSIAKVDTLRGLHSLDFAQEAVVQTVLENQPETSKALKKALTHNDIKIQLEGVERFTDMVAAIQPRGGKPIQISNTTQVANMPQQSPTVRESHFIGFEDRVRQIGTKIKETNLLPSETSTTFDDNNLADDSEEEAET